MAWKTPFGASANRNAIRPPFRAFGLRARDVWQHTFEINDRLRQNPAYKSALIFLLYSFVLEA